MKKKTVILPSGEVEIDIIRSRRRTVALYVRPEGSLLVRAPWYVPSGMLMQFVHRKVSWIEKQMGRLKDARPVADQRPVSEGSLIAFMGGLLTVKVCSGSRNSAFVRGNELHLAHAGEISASGITAMTEAWYLREAKRYFRSRTEELAVMHSSLLPAPGAVKVRKMKRRWGTCHSDGTIWLNRELIKKDPELIDYVIVHELCHLVHHNHGSEYYALLGRIIPDYRELRRKLLS